MVFVSPDRIQHCLIEYVHPGHPDFPRRRRPRRGRPGARRLPAARRRARHAGRALRSRRRGHADVRPRPPARHPGAQHEPRARRSSGYLGWPADRAWWRLLAWGRLRSIARDAYDKLGLHGKVAVPTPRPTGPTPAPTPASSRPARASRSRSGSRARRNRRAGGLRARPRSSRPGAAGIHRPRHRAAPDQIGAAARRGAQRCVPRSCPRPPARGRAAVLADSRPFDGRAGRLALGRSPSRGCVRGHRVGSHDRAWRGDLTSGLCRHDPDRRRTGVPATPVRPPPRAIRCTATRSRRKSSSGCASSATSSDRAPLRG